MAPNSPHKDDERVAAFGGQAKNSLGSPGNPSVSGSLARGGEFVDAPAFRAMDSAETRIRSLEEELSRPKDTASDIVSGNGGEGARSATDLASNATEQMGDFASNVAERAADVASTAAANARSSAGKLESMMRSNPLALAGAVLIGALIGMLGRRR